jgi:hypothetical protein
MLPSSGRASRRRTLLALLALVANLIAAGVPVLHAAAHAVHEGEPHHEEAPLGHPALDHTDHDHDAVHPEALHDDAPPRGRSIVVFAFPAPADLPRLPITVHERRDTPIPVPRLSSRAPPPGDPARAPPLT